MYIGLFTTFTKIAILKISVGIARAGRKRGNRRTDKLTLAAHARLNEINDQPYTILYYYTSRRIFGERDRASTQ